MVGGRICHADSGAIDDDNATPFPPAALTLLLQIFGSVREDFFQFGCIEFAARLLYADVEADGTGIDRLAARA